MNSLPILEPILVGNWNVHWGYGILSHGHMNINMYFKAGDPWVLEAPLCCSSSRYSGIRYKGGDWPGLRPDLPVSQLGHLSPRFPPLFSEPPPFKDPPKRLLATYLATRLLLMKNLLPLSPSFSSFPRPSKPCGLLCESPDQRTE